MDKTFRHFTLALHRNAHSFSRIWNSPRTAFTLISLSIGTSIYYILKTPPPGYAVALLGTVAAVMCVRENSDSQKFCWLATIAALLLVEFHAIRVDRTENDKNQEQRFQAQMRQLNNAVSGIASTMQQDQRHFDATIRKADDLLDSTQEVSNIARTNLEEFTGANSIPYVRPVATGGASDPITLEVGDRGKNMLTNVAFTIRNVKDWEHPVDDFTFFHRPEIEVAVIHPGLPRILKEVITPHTDSPDQIDRYLIYIYTQNDYFSELLEFRVSKDRTRWASRYTVSRQILTHHGYVSTSSLPLCGSFKWSDEAVQSDPIKLPHPIKPCEEN